MNKHIQDKLKEFDKEIMEYLEARFEILSEGHMVRENGIAIRELYVLRYRLITQRKALQEAYKKGVQDGKP